MAEPVPFEEALAVVLDSVRPLDAATVDILDALERVVARDVLCDHDVPAHATSQVDGFALVAGDLEAADADNPVTLPPAGQVSPGETPADVLAPGTCVRVRAGSQIPAGADAVVSDDAVTRGEGAVRIPFRARPGDHILRQGAYFESGQLILREGQVVFPEEINILAALGRAQVDVVSRPRVAVLVTGSELMEVGQGPAPGKQWGSNLYHLMARVRQVGGDPVNLGVVRDDRNAIVEALGEALTCDAVLTTGSTSGDGAAILREALAQRSATVRFEKTRFRPGETFTFATAGPRPVFCLPGSPRSLVTLFHLFVRPALLAMAGQPRRETEEVAAILEQDLLTKPGTMKFIFSRLTRTVTGYSVKPLRELARGGFVTSDSVNALLVVPEDVAYLKSQFEVSVIPLHDI